MRGLERNMVNFWYANVTGTKAVRDESGYDTGEYATVYTSPMRVRGNISPPYGQATRELFGVDIQYDMVITMFLPSPEIREDSVLWIGYSPSDHPTHTHIVKSISKSLNILQIAVSRVNIS